MFGRNDGVIVRAEVIAERRRGVRLGRVDHDGAPVESEAFGGAIADAVRPLAADAEQIENEDTEFCALGWARSADVTAICVPRGGRMSISANPASRCSEAVTAFSRAGAGMR